MNAEKVDFSSLRCVALVCIAAMSSAHTCTPHMGYANDRVDVRHTEQTVDLSCGSQQLVT
eukprot:41507-Eustigmatos_ZCMA.PRE.1